MSSETSSRGRSGPSAAGRRQASGVRDGDERHRCQWVGSDEAMVRYHDDEWGVPVRDDRVLFEFLVLEGAQAGLSWSTVLKKRENYRRCFDGFDPTVIVGYDERKIQALLADPGIVRNKLKVRGVVKNAAAFLKVVDEFGSFADYLWAFVDGSPIQNAWQRSAAVPAKTALSDKLSKDLKRRGFTFVGSTIVYAFMQAVGMVNDHEMGCFRHDQIRRMG